ncbi:MAG: hypothetical protein HDQ90_01675 [Desulfovibrio sp.]|nr:hypothetical protein [Desulfovibrio sp.]
MWAMLGKALGTLTGGVLGGLFGRKGGDKGIAGELARASERVLSGRASQNEAQGRINSAEIEGAPQSRLRLWRSFLGWVLTLLFAWEVAGRLIVIPILFPQLERHLPPSALDQILTVLLGMLGLGF